MDSLRVTLSIILISGVKGVLIQTNDVTLDVNSFDIRCSPANSEMLLHVNSFTLHRNGTPVALVTYNRTSKSSNLIIPDVTDNRFRYNLTGNVHDENPANKFLRVVVPANLTRCRDAGNYTCVLNGRTSDDSSNYVDQASRYVRVKTTATAMDEIFTPPTNDNMLDPSGGGRFLIGTTYRFTCTGIVGNPPVSLRWCYKQSGEGGFAPLLAYTAEISESEPEVYQDCNYKRQSFLNYTMTTQDVNTVLLCEPESSMFFCGNGALNKTFVVRAFPRNSGTLNDAVRCQISSSIFMMFIFSVVNIL
ncbi:uncharacterized protein LOC133173132 [Saccostrea echinata]|uniref:uncharacterized protein LOC133173132 n=1 Tax=Saccostrea echinata TaxID=191078 RepID=UPI002A81D7B4|nr:uncharacterized protein LOC133173132 [Saccostrea echinata]